MFIVRYTDDISWNTMTPAEKITLHVYPMLCLVLGSNYLFTDIDRLVQSPTLKVADSVLDIQIWGAGFLLCGFGMIVALIVRRAYWIPLAAMVGLCGVWSITFLVAALVDVASPGGWAWPAAVGVLGWASIRGLAKNERNERPAPASSRDKE